MVANEAREIVSVMQRELHDDIDDPIVSKSADNADAHNCIQTT